MNAFWIKSCNFPGKQASILIALTHRWERTHSEAPEKGHSLKAHSWTKQKELLSRFLLESRKETSTLRLWSGFSSAPFVGMRQLILLLPGLGDGSGTSHDFPCVRNSLSKAGQRSASSRDKDLGGLNAEGDTWVCTHMSRHVHMVGVNDPTPQPLVKPLTTAHTPWPWPSSCAHMSGVCMRLCLYLHRYKQKDCFLAAKHIFGHQWIFQVT